MSHKCHKHNETLATSVAKSQHAKLTIIWIPKSPQRHTLFPFPVNYFLLMCESHQCQQQLCRQCHQHMSGGLR